MPSCQKVERLHCAFWGICPGIQNFFENSSVYLHGESNAAWVVFVGGLVDKTVGGFVENLGCVESVSTLFDNICCV